MAVVARLRADLHAEHAPCTRAIVDHDRMAESLFQATPEHACNIVDIAASGKRHDHAQRTRREGRCFGCEGMPGRQTRHRPGQAKQQRAADPPRMPSVAPS
jgi:hypothetical protein